MPGPRLLRVFGRACAGGMLAALSLVPAVATATAAGAPTRPPQPPVSAAIGGSSLPVVTTEAPVVGAGASAGGLGYWVAAADGHVWAYGHAAKLGDLAGRHLNAPIVGIASTPDGHGYWLVASDGGVFTFGTARFFGSTGGRHLNSKVLGIVATASGRGYWLIAGDGGVFTFGDGRFYGSTGNRRLNSPIVGMARAREGRGYWLVAADGGIFTFGRAPYLGSLGAHPPRAPIAGMAADATRAGYSLFGVDGSVYVFGGATFKGSIFPDTWFSFGRSHGVRGLVMTPSDNGYWLVTDRGAVLPYGDADWFGSVVRHRVHTRGTPVMRVYGDSLVTQATPELRFQATVAGFRPQNRSFLGTAMCDWLPDMTDPKQAPADVVVLAFSGNWDRPCMPRDADIDEYDYVVGYRHAAEQAIAALSAQGTMVVFALPPPRLDQPSAAELPNLFRDTAQKWSRIARSYDAGALVSGPHRTWIEKLPCLPFETATYGCNEGEIAVRGPDHLHFCPGTLRNRKDLFSGCSVWSSGSWRYATGLVAAARRGES